MQVTPATFTGKIRIVCRRNQAHSLRCSRKHVTDGIRKVLEFISLESDLVMNDEVMRGFRRSLKSAMCCEDDIKLTNIRRTNFDVHLVGRNQSGTQMSHLDQQQFLVEDCHCGRRCLPRQGKTEYGDVCPAYQ